MYTWYTSETNFTAKMDSEEDSKIQVDNESFSIKPMGDLVCQDAQLSYEQITNNTGGYVYKVTDKTRVLRFLCLGSEGGSYYVSEKELKRENVQCIDRYKII